MKAAETKTTATAQHLTKGEGQELRFFRREEAGSALDNGQPSFFSPNGSVGLQPRPFFGKRTVQTQLHIGQPGDKYEQEADRTADQVVQRLAESENGNGNKQPISTAQSALQRRPIFESEAAPEVQAKSLNGHALHVPQIQKKCAECEREDDLQEMEAPGEKEGLQRKPIFDSATPPPEELGEGVQRKNDTRAGNSALQLNCADCAAEEDVSVQREEATDGASAAPDGLTSRLDRSKGGGSPLSKDTRAQMEGSFGTDFSGVRVHTDSSAGQMNEELGAQAFTYGSDIYFGAGKFDVSGTSGQHLLAHELTHTVQQGAPAKNKGTPQVQKDDDDNDPVQEAASKVYDALEGWTDSADSKIILDQFTSIDKSTTDTIVSAVASKAGDSIAYVYDWMYGDMVTSDWNNLFSHFKNVNAYRVDHLIASQVYSYLSGYTSVSNSNSILAIYTTNSPVTGDLLGRSLVQLEGVTGYNRNDTAQYLFGDLTLLDANKLSFHFFGSSDTTAAGYAAHWIAAKVRDLLAGFTGLDDSESIVENFERTPAELRSKVLYELEQLCQAKWGQTAADAMMKDMWQSDYETLRTLMPGLLPVYSIERNWLEWTWDKLLDLYDFLSALVEYGVCGLIGVIWGVLTVVGDVIVAVVDLVVAVKDLLGLIVYAISGGKFCRENKEKVYGFFTAMGQMFDAPGDAITSMWDELTTEVSLIEGPFSACKKAVFWTSRVINLVVNIVLIIAAGYGAVKIALKGIEAVVSLVDAGKLVSALKALPGKLWGRIKKLPGAASKAILTGASKVIGLLKNPVEIIGAARNTLTAVRLAVGDEGYFKFLRSQLGEAIEGESQFWKKRREFWKRSADEIEPRLNTTESKLTTAVETTVDDPAKAEALIGEAQTEANSSKAKCDELMEDVRAGKGKGTEEPKTAKPAAESKGPKTETPPKELPKLEGEVASLDGQRSVVVTEKGKIWVCASPCQELRLKYEAEIRSDPRFEKRIKNLENGYTDLTPEQKAVRDGQIKQLEQDLADLKAKNEGKVPQQLPREIGPGEEVTIPYKNGKIRARVAEVQADYVKFDNIRGVGGKSTILSITTRLEQFGQWLKEGKAIRWLGERGRLMKVRPDYEPGLVDKIWEKAKGADGNVRDPNPPFEELNWDKSKNRFDQWHMGHKPGAEYVKLVDRYVNGEISYSEFLKEYNNPANYRPELPAKNLSHEFEQKNTKP